MKVSSERLWKLMQKVSGETCEHGWVSVLGGQSAREINDVIARLHTGLPAAEVLTETTSTWTRTVGSGKGRSHNTLLSHSTLICNNNT